MAGYEVGDLKVKKRNLSIIYQNANIVKLSYIHSYAQVHVGAIQK